MASSLISRMMLAFKAGLQFAGRRNLYEVFGYNRRITAVDLYAKYQRQDIVSRIVNMPPEEMWSLAPELETAGVAAKWKKFVGKTELWDRIIQADKLCSFGPFSCMLLGMPGAMEKAAPPLNDDLSNLLYLQAYGGDNVKVQTYESDITKPRYGLPLQYQVMVGPSVGTTSVLVHHTRIIHIVDRPLMGQMFAEPRLAQINNLLEDLLKICGGSAELFWITANRGMQVDVDKEMDLDSADAAALTDELDEFHHNLRRYVRTRGVKITNLGADVADPRGPFNVCINLLAAATNIPQRILIGAEAGQLASEQDRANWSEYVERRRKTFGEPYVLRAILKKLGELSYIKDDVWETATWKWPEAFHTNPVERSNLVASYARAVTNLSRRVQFGDPVITKEEAREMMDLPAKVPASQEMPEPLPEPAPAPAAKGPSAGGVDSVTDHPSKTTKSTDNDPNTNQQIRDDTTNEFAASASASAAQAANAATQTAASLVSVVRHMTEAAGVSPPMIEREIRASRDPKTGELVGKITEKPIELPEIRT